MIKFNGVEIQLLVSAALEGCGFEDSELDAIARSLDLKSRASFFEKSTSPNLGILEKTLRKIGIAPELWSPEFRIFSGQCQGGCDYRDRETAFSYSEGLNGGNQNELVLAEIMKDILQSGNSEFIPHVQPQEHFIESLGQTIGYSEGSKSFTTSMDSLSTPLDSGRLYGACTLMKEKIRFDELARNFASRAKAAPDCSSLDTEFDPAIKQVIAPILPHVANLNTRSLDHFSKFCAECHSNSNAVVDLHIQTFQQLKGYRSADSHRPLVDYIRSGEMPKKHQWSKEKASSWEKARKVMIEELSSP